MPMMMVDSNLLQTRPFGSCPSILLASDSQQMGNVIFRILRDAGFKVRYAGAYSDTARLLREQTFDIVLLEVTSIEAVEAAVETALLAKRTRSGQFVGYLADPALDSSGLAGDALFPRNPARLPHVLRSFFTAGEHLATV